MTFREQVIAFAKRTLAIVPKCLNEEQTKQYLVLPFLRLLGYDPDNPNHVVAEHSADYSEKYRNRVDYLLKTDGAAAIALECKPCRADLKADRGQIRSYFNALTGRRVGGLTNGLEYEFYIDSIETNRMDEEPFLSVNLESWANGEARTADIDVLESLGRERFDPDLIISQAEQRLLKQDFVRQFGEELRHPSDALCKLFLQRADYTHISKQAMESTYRSLVKTAMEETIAHQIWNRLQAKKQADASTRTQDGNAANGIETTERELYVFGYAQRRLAFLVQQDAALFPKIEDIGYKDFTSKFGVFYKKPKLGRMFDFYEEDNGRDYFVFSEGLGEFEVGDDLERLDQPLLTIFKTRVRELADS
jgi:hypothetical protein